MEDIEIISDDDSRRCLDDIEKNFKIFSLLWRFGD